MFSPEAVPLLVLAAVSAYLCFLGPGQAWWRGRGSPLPRLFARVALSAAWTSAVGLWLAAFGLFSLPRVVVVNALLTLTGYLLVARVRDEGLPPAAGGGAAAVFLIAVALYWPGYQPHFAGSDATTYVAAGANLARTHRLSKTDPLVEQLPARLRRQVFKSALGRPWSPPYGRMPGGMVMATPDSSEIHPNFFPVPMVWSGLFADALGPRHAGAFAPVFAALAVWAAWLFARRRFGVVASAVVASLTALNAAGYFAGRMPMSEPVAWFFLWAGLCALDAWEEDGVPGDARLAAVLLATTGLVRVDYLVLVSCALAARHVLADTVGGRRLTPGFIIVFCAMTVLTLLATWTVQGAYATPIVDTWDGLLYRLQVAWQRTPVGPLALAFAVTTVLAAAVVRAGPVRGLLGAGVVGLIVTYTLLASQFELLRSARWMGAYLGWPTLALAAVGLRRTWKDRRVVGGDGFLVVLVCVVGGLVAYDPHVLPAMPWAARRFVPFIVPVLLVLAAAGAASLGRRSAIAGALAWIVFISSVLLPARGLWGHEFFEGSYDQLAEFNALVPDDGVFLIDARLYGYQLGTPLWLIHERDNLPVETSGVRGRRTAAVLTYALAETRPVYLVRPTLAAVKPLPFVGQRKAADYTFQVLLPEQTAARPPRERQKYTTSVSIDRLLPWPRKPGPAPPAGDGAGASERPHEPAR